MVFIIGGFIGYGAFLEGAQVDAQATQVLPAITIFGYALSLGFSALFIYRLFHQIKMMRQILQGVEANVFNPRKVYALSSYGAAFAAALFIAQVFPSLPLTNFLASPGALISLYGTGVMLLIAFFVPLAEINKRLRANKDRLLAEIGTDLSEIQERTHLALKKGKFAEVDKMRGSLSTLREQRELVQKISTWPWQPDTLRNLLTPLLIPLVVFIMQRLLTNWFGLQ